MFDDVMTKQLGGLVFDSQCRQQPVLTMH